MQIHLTLYGQFGVSIDGHSSAADGWRHYWAATLRRLALPPVTPHSARHSFISTVVTLSHYTHAMRGGEDAAKALALAYAGAAS